ncbi:unnamed protein product [Cyprideis torosa]|uniref:Uncharacterized protein n=1 Tax=Cyprideis torosa TaxID=163714 RepID=A0A7R8W0W0_9CRUS|nr:unnamed protein product [Cyprideis torosa]CAG0880213.1 unnamed protein product [Cyprideis torosa]
MAKIVSTIADLENVRREEKKEADGPSKHREGGGHSEADQLLTGEIWISYKSGRQMLSATQYSSLLRQVNFSTSYHNSPTMYKIALALALVAVALADRPTYAPAPYQPAYRPAYQPTYDEKPSYSYEYAVKDDYSGNDYSAQETRDGYNTQGSYRVLLPDGRVQTVTYTVNGDSGFVADVKYEGYARYDTHKPAPAYKPAPSYQRPVYAPAPRYGH